MTNKERCKKCVHRVVCPEQEYFDNVDHLGERCRYYMDKNLINRQKAEIERLKETPKCVYAYDGEVMEYCVEGPCHNYKTADEIKAEAIKEFVERFENNIAYMGSEIKQMAGVTLEKTCSNCKYSDSCASNYCDAVWNRAYNIRDGEDCWRPRVEMVGNEE